MIIASGFCGKKSAVEENPISSIYLINGRTNAAVFPGFSSPGLSASHDIIAVTYYDWECVFLNRSGIFVATSPNVAQDLVTKCKNVISVNSVIGSLLNCRIDIFIDSFCMITPTVTNM